MNSQQRKYALDRIEEIRAAKVQVLKTKHTSKAVTLSQEQKFKLIEDGKVNLTGNSNYYGYITGAFDFSKFEKNATISIAGKNAIEKLNKEAQVVKDKVALGESSEALAAIAAFEK